MSSSSSELKRLSDDVIARIRAGEVVLSPSSAVKELLENALDAGAQSLSLALSSGGLKRLSLKDDGCGIDKQSLPHVCERYTTSKLSCIDDIKRLETFGFRGEALASISRVGHVRITSRTRDSSVAYEARYEHSALVGDKVRPVAGTVGTTITVEDLFYNEPLRLKAMAGRQADETRAIVDVTRAYALHYAGCAFQCRDDASSAGPLLVTTSSMDRTAVAERLYGRSELARLDFADAALDVHCQAVFSTLAAAESPQHRYTFVLFINNRLVQHPALKAAVKKLYAAAAAAVRALVYVALRLPPHNVDPNVHPTKSEVYFLNADAIVDLVVKRIQTALLEQFTTTHDDLAASPARISPTAPSHAQLPPSRSLTSLFSALAPPVHQSTPHHQLSPTRPTTQSPIAPQSPITFSSRVESPTTQSPSITVQAQPTPIALTHQPLANSNTSSSPTSPVSRFAPNTPPSSSSPPAALLSPGLFSPSQTLGQSSPLRQPARPPARATVARPSPSPTRPFSSPPPPHSPRSPAVSSTQKKITELGFAPIDVDNDDSVDKPVERAKRAAPEAQHSGGRQVASIDEDSDDDIDDDERTPRKGVLPLFSVQSALRKIDVNSNADYLEVLRKGTFLGCHGERTSCILFEHSVLYLVDNYELSKSLVFQLCYVRMGRFTSFGFARVSIRQALEVYRAHSGAAVDVAASVALLVDKAAMLREYYKIDVSSDGSLSSLPIIVEGYVPFLPALPALLYELSNRVDYSNEDGCFETVATALANFYALRPDYRTPTVPFAVSERGALLFAGHRGDDVLQRARQQLTEQTAVFAVDDARGAGRLYVVDTPAAVFQQLAAADEQPVHAAECVLPDKPVHLVCFLDGPSQSPAQLDSILVGVKSLLVGHWQAEAKQGTTEELSRDWLVLTSSSPSRLSVRLHNPAMLFASPPHLVLFLTRAIRKIRAAADDPDSPLHRLCIGADTFLTLQPFRKWRYLRLVYSVVPHLRTLVPLDNPDGAPDRAVFLRSLATRSFTSTAVIKYPDAALPDLSQLGSAAAKKFRSPSPAAGVDKIIARCVLPMYQARSLKLRVPAGVTWMKPVPLFQHIIRPCPTDTDDTE